MKTPCTLNSYFQSKNFPAIPRNLQWYLLSSLRLCWCSRNYLWRSSSSYTSYFCCCLNLVHETHFVTRKNQSHDHFLTWSAEIIVKSHRGDKIDPPENQCKIETTKMFFFPTYGNVQIKRLISLFLTFFGKYTRKNFVSSRKRKTEAIQNDPKNSNDNNFVRRWNLLYLSLFQYILVFVFVLLVIRKKEEKKITTMSLNDTLLVFSLF